MASKFKQQFYLGDNELTPEMIRDLNTVFACLSMSRVFPDGLVARLRDTHGVTSRFKKD